MLTLRKKQLWDIISLLKDVNSELWGKNCENLEFRIVRVYCPIYTSVFILVYTGVFTAFLIRSPSTLITKNACHMTIQVQQWAWRHCLHGRQGYTEQMWAAMSLFSKVSVLVRLAYIEMQLQRFQTKTGSAAFSKVSVFECRIRRSSVNDRHNHSKSYAF